MSILRIIPTCAVNTKRFTYIALVFIPLAWVGSFFNMTDGFTPGEARFWLYFATAVAILGLFCLLRRTLID